MIPVTTYHDRPIAVFGLGASGMVAAIALQAGAARVDVWDDNADRRNLAQSAGLSTVDLYAADMADYDALVVAPGVPLTHPAPHALVTKANDGGVSICGDIELFAQMRAQLPGHQVVAITGTNGKSTTTALITHILNASGGQALACGNIGTPILDLEPLAEGGVYVIEMSSYQIDLTHTLKPDLAILLNVAPDHLDRHGTIENYAAVKRRLLEGQSADGLAIIGVDDIWGQAAFEQLKQAGRSNVVPVSVERIVEDGIYALEGQVFDGRLSTDTPVLDLHAINSLPGSHNWQNSAVAYAVATALGLSAAQIQTAMEQFPGLAHRSEFIAEIDGIRFINDSKATNVDAAIRALASFNNIHWIAGGRAKDEPLAPIAEHAANITKAYLIGEAQDDMANSLSAMGVESVKCGTLEVAFAQAMAAGKAMVEGKSGAPATILLSPACASFDQFANFEIRGEAFRALVNDQLLAMDKGGCA
jgi:UDP-N-acetylmuramoylalanine--D-glutamate ligase